jgi:hypothetical protein
MVRRADAETCVTLEEMCRIWRKAATVVKAAGAGPISGET